MRLTVFFDYTCTHSYRLNELLKRITKKQDLTVKWRTLSLKEFRREEDEPSAFEEGFSSFSLLALALAHGVPAKGFLQYHNTLFDAAHGKHLELTYEDLIGIAESAGLDPKKIKREGKAWLRAVVEDHHAGVHRWNAHGTPTAVFDGKIAAYLRLNGVPANDRDATKLWNTILKVARGHPDLIEYKRSV